MALGAALALGVGSSWFVLLQPERLSCSQEPGQNACVSHEKEGLHTLEMRLRCLLPGDLELLPHGIHEELGFRLHHTLYSRIRGQGFLLKSGGLGVGPSSRRVLRSCRACSPALCHGDLWRKCLCARVSRWFRVAGVRNSGNSDEVVDVTRAFRVADVALRMHAAVGNRAFWCYHRVSRSRVVLWHFQ